MSLKDERYVCTLADCGTIREAAEKLYISPPALSMYIHKLEASLGIDLFYHSRQRFYPTEIGERYIARCRKLLEIDSQFSRELEEYRHRKTNVLSIGMYKRCAVSLWMPLQKALRQQFPNLEFRLTVDKPDALQRLLNNGKLDYILLSLPWEPTIQQFHVGNDELLLACPTSWELSKDAAEPYPCISLSDIPSEKVFLPGENQSIYAFVSQFLRASGIDFSHFPTLNNMEISMQNVTAGIGCCFTLRSYIPTFPSLENISFYRLATPTVTVPWYLECLDSTMNRRNFFLFKETVTKLLSQALK